MISSDSYFTQEAELNFLILFSLCSNVPKDTHWVLPLGPESTLAKDAWNHTTSPGPHLERPHTALSPLLVLPMLPDGEVSH